MSYVKKYYDAISTFKINIPTTVYGSIPYPLKQYASCVLVDIDDTLPSIFSSDMVKRYVAQKSEISELTQEGSEVSTHVLEAVRYNIQVLFLFLKNLKSTVKCCTQNGVRRINNRTL